MTMLQQNSSLFEVRKTVLVVEDEVGLRFVICTFLREYGNFIVVEAQNADEALLYLHSGEKIDFVFTDVRMPGTVDGIQLTRQVLREFPGIKILRTSGNLLQQERIPGVDLMVKPYDIDDVLKLINAMLSEK